MESDPKKTLLNTPSRIVHRFPLDGTGLKRLTEAGLAWLRTNQQVVNALNVFPVPDGDTGTNMVLTMQAAIDEISRVKENNAGKMAHAIAHGALMGARGNSGVILSQLWRGFARELDSLELVDGESLVRAFRTARDTAYKGVVRPVEGTILTVAKDIAAAAEEALKVTQDPFEILEFIVPAGELSVQKTPELLPVLKEAGVVDSGGKGLFFIFEGMLRYVQGLSLEVSTVAVPLSAMKLEETMESIEPGQDFEWVIDFRPHTPLQIDTFYSDLEEMGTSIQLGEGEGIYRLHIHVPENKRDLPLHYTFSLGTVTKATFENLIDQMDQSAGKSHNHPVVLTPVKNGEIAVVAVSPGDGIGRVFASLGAAAIVQGGQSMNPSTQELLQAFENLPTDKVIILPNNKNIIPTAEAAAELTAKHLAVIPSKTIPQGLAAMMRLIPDGDFVSVVDEMKSSLDEIQSGEITTATRSVEIDNVEVKEGQIIALHNGKLVYASESIEDACLGLLEKAGTEDYELITLFYGDTINQREANRIADIIRTKYPDQELEIQEGSQPHYHFIISIE
ncbi:MAG: DAK2 domain-containing protein [Chloroflexi bacterium]|nr:MAG: DAK2 domain-containing protein [Chloroflexota bacterium]